LINVTSFLFSVNYSLRINKKSKEFKNPIYFYRKLYRIKVLIIGVWGYMLNKIVFFLLVSGSLFAQDELVKTMRFSQPVRPDFSSTVQHPVCINASDYTVKIQMVREIEFCEGIKFIATDKNTDQKRKFYLCSDQLGGEGIGNSNIMAAKYDIKDMLDSGKVLHFCYGELLRSGQSIDDESPGRYRLMLLQYR
jgi:hypothetical protein